MNKRYFNEEGRVVMGLIIAGIIMYLIGVILEWIGDIWRNCR